MHFIFRVVLGSALALVVLMDSTCAVKLKRQKRIEETTKTKTSSKTINTHNNKNTNNDKDMSVVVVVPLSRKSPFQPPDEHGNTINFKENHLRLSQHQSERQNSQPEFPRKSPFTPPPSPPHQLQEKKRTNSNLNTKSDTDTKTSFQTTRTTTKTTSTKSPTTTTTVTTNQQNTNEMLTDNNKKKQSQSSTAIQTPNKAKILQSPFKKPSSDKRRETFREKKGTAAERDQQNRNQSVQGQQHQKISAEVRRSPSSSVKAGRKQRQRHRGSLKLKTPGGATIIADLKSAHRPTLDSVGRIASPELRGIMARQEDNSRDIPAIASILLTVKDSRGTPQPTKSTNGQIKRLKSNRSSQPRTISYQNKTKRHRDMHEVGPGVTPWTRYTARPRNVYRRIGGQNMNKGRCGRRKYAPRSQICCNGNILKRSGIHPSCCGRQTYDAVFNKCCDGVIVRATAQADGC